MRKPFLCSLGSVYEGCFRSQWHKPVHFCLGLFGYMLLCSLRLSVRIVDLRLLRWA